MRTARRAINKWALFVLLLVMVGCASSEFGPSLEAAFQEGGAFCVYVPPSGMGPRTRCVYDDYCECERVRSQTYGATLCLVNPRTPLGQAWTAAPNSHAKWALLRPTCKTGAPEDYLPKIR